MFKALKNWLEKFIPMTLGSFALFALVVYLVIIVGKTVWDNYQSNKQIIAEQEKVQEMEDDLEYMMNEIAYLKTYSFREKQARAKLGYVATGEKVLSLPTDEPAPGDKITEETEEKEPNIQNYYLWYEYFTH